ncbi:MAG: hypothetical protein ACKKL6_03165 [Candidatus Komeilibacteria bacterium]
MSDDIKKPEMASSEEPKLAKPKKAGKGGMLAKIIMILIVVVIILGGLYFVDKYTKINIFGMNDAEKVTITDWQAVFLTNGQVYFGKIQSYNSNFVQLEDIYYLQVVQAPLQQTQEGAATQTQGQNELSLVKLGNELHGPQDAMKINADHVLFTEKLKSDSKVVDAITRYLEEQQNQ